MLKLVNFARVPSFFGSNCYVIISIRIFIFALKHQLDLNTWVCQYLNKVMTIIQYGAIQYYRDTLEINFRLIGGKLCGESKRDYWQKRGFSTVG